MDSTAHRHARTTVEQLPHGGSKPLRTALTLASSVRKESAAVSSDALLARNRSLIDSLRAAPRALATGGSSQPRRSDADPPAAPSRAQSRRANTLMQSAAQMAPFHACEGQEQDSVSSLRRSEPSGSSSSSLPPPLQLEPVWLAASDPRRLEPAEGEDTSVYLISDSQVALATQLEPRGAVASTSTHIHYMLHCTSTPQSPSYTLCLIPPLSALLQSLHAPNASSSSHFKLHHVDATDVYGAPVAQEALCVATRSGRQFITGAKVQVQLWVQVMRGQGQGVLTVQVVSPHAPGALRLGLCVHTLGDGDLQRLHRGVLGPPLGHSSHDAAALAARHNASSAGAGEGGYYVQPLEEAFERYWRLGSVRPLPASAAMVQAHRVALERAASARTPQAAAVPMGTAPISLQVRDAEGLYQSIVSLQFAHSSDHVDDVFVPLSTLSMQRLKPPPHTPFVTMAEYRRLQAEIQRAGDAPLKRPPPTPARTRSKEQRRGVPRKPQVTFCSICHVNVDVYEHCYGAAAEAHAANMTKEAALFSELTALQRSMLPAAAASESGRDVVQASSMAACNVSFWTQYALPDYAAGTAALPRKDATDVPYTVLPLMEGPINPMNPLHTCSVASPHAPLVQAALEYRAIVSAPAYASVYRQFAAGFPDSVQQLAVHVISALDAAKALPSLGAPRARVAAPCKLTYGALQRAYSHHSVSSSDVVLPSFAAAAPSFGSSAASALDVLFPRATRDAAIRPSAVSAAIAASRALPWTVLDVPAARCKLGWPCLVGQGCVEESAAPAAAKVSEDIHLPVSLVEQLVPLHAVTRAAAMAGWRDASPPRPKAEKIKAASPLPLASIGTGEQRVSCMDAQLDEDDMPTPPIGDDVVLMHLASPARATRGGSASRIGVRASAQRTLDAGNALGDVPAVMPLPSAGKRRRDRLAAGTVDEPLLAASPEDDAGDATAMGTPIQGRSGRKRMRAAQAAADMPLPAPSAELAPAPVITPAVPRAAGRHVEPTPVSFSKPSDVALLHRLHGYACKHAAVTRGRTPVLRVGAEDDFGALVKMRRRWRELGAAEDEANCGMVAMVVLDALHLIVHG